MNFFFIGTWKDSMTIDEEDIQVDIVLQREDEHLRRIYHRICLIDETAESNHSKIKTHVDWENWMNSVNAKLTKIIALSSMECDSLHEQSLAELLAL